MLPIAIRREGAWYGPGSLMQRELDWLARRISRLWPLAGERAGPYPVDILEAEEAVTVEAELPGFKREEVSLTIGNGILTITAERKPAEATGTVHLAERQFTRNERSFYLPAGVDEARAEARLEDGVLHVRLPKTQVPGRKQIQVT